jgi:hypothetical protein
MSFEFDNLVSRAEAGDSDAQREVSIRLQNGDGVAPDLERAKYRLRMAAENGDAWSQTQHAILLRSTKLPEKERESVHWLTLAASQGDARARYTLGSQQFLGIGTDIDIERATANLIMASLSGADEARNMILKILPSLSPNIWEAIARMVDWAQLTFVMGKSVSGSGPDGVEPFQNDDEWAADPSQWLRQEQEVANAIFRPEGGPSILSAAFGAEVTVKRIYVGRSIVSGEKLFATTISLQDILQPDSMPVWWKPPMANLEAIATTLGVLEGRKWIRSSYMSH